MILKIFSSGKNLLFLQDVNQLRVKKAMEYENLWSATTSTPHSAD